MSDFLAAFYRLGVPSLWAAGRGESQDSAGAPSVCYPVRSPTPLAEGGGNIPLLEHNTMANAKPARSRKTKPPLIEFPAALTWEQVEDHEARNDIAVRRRLMLATLTRSGHELLAGFRKHDDNCETLVATVEQIAAHRSYLKSCVELADAAYARLLVVADALIVETEGASA
jgi:hypothetical protein